MTSREHFDQWCKNELAEGRDHYALSAWAAWQASRAQALEDAAKVCDMHEMEVCAATIRLMKDKK